MTREKLREKFGAYRRPTEITIPKFEAIQEKTFELAVLIFDSCPPSDERDDAFRALMDVRMRANASIAIHTSPAMQAALFPPGRGPDSLPS